MNASRMETPLGSVSGRGSVVTLTFLAFNAVTALGDCSGARVRRVAAGRSATDTMWEIHRVLVLCRNVTIRPTGHPDRMTSRAQGAAATAVQACLTCSDPQLMAERSLERPLQEALRGGSDSS
jgi:hypothetical protein